MECSWRPFDCKIKWDYPLLNGAVRDIAWTFDNERVAVVGEG